MIKKIGSIFAVLFILSSCADYSNVVKNNNPATRIIYGCQLACGDTMINPGKGNVVYNERIFSYQDFTMLHNGPKGFTRVTSGFKGREIASSKVTEEKLNSYYKKLSDSNNKNITAYKAFKNENISIQAFSGKVIEVFYKVDNKVLYMVTFIPITAKTIDGKLERITATQGAYTNSIDDYKAPLAQIMKYAYNLTL